MTKSKYKIYFSVLFFLIFSDLLSIEALSVLKETQAISPAVSKKKLVAIDPGHGGKDIGCKSPNGLTEKEITLKLALMVKDILSKNPVMDVFLPTKQENLPASIPITLLSEIQP